MVTSSAKKVVSSPFHENNYVKMQQKKNNKGHHKATSSTPNNNHHHLRSGHHGPAQSHSHQHHQCKKSLFSSNSTPSAKKSLQYGTPPKTKGQTHSLPATPVSIMVPQPLFSSNMSSSSRSSSTPSPKSNHLYAGSKCYEPPTPESLPRPPTAWTGSKSRTNMKALMSSMQFEEQLQFDSRDHNEEVSRHLKLLLNVPN